MFGVMVVSLLLISSVVMVSAGFWGDLFTFGEEGEDLEGELAELARVDITVLGKPVVDIVYVSDIDNRAPIAGDSVARTFTFYGDIKKVVS